jgi:hypothetical protein
MYGTGLDFDVLHYGREGGGLALADGRLKALVCLGGTAAAAYHQRSAGGSW